MKKTSRFIILLFSFFFLLNNDFLLSKPINEKQTSKNTYNTLPKYLLGPGDILNIKVYKFENFNSNVTILPDGTINLPRVNSLYIKNLTLDEANILITKNYEKIIKNPLIYINLIKSRPVRINVNGAIQRPGIYTLNSTDSNDFTNSKSKDLLSTNKAWPTVVEALQKAGGLAPDADLRKIKLRRYNKIHNNISEFNINFWEQFSNGGIIQNNEIFDGDSIFVERSSNTKPEEKVLISSSNLSQSTITVTVIGEVKIPGKTDVRASSPAEQAILNAGGFTDKSNKNEYSLLRLKNNGRIERKIIRINGSTNKKITFLKDSDVIFVDKNSLAKRTTQLKGLVEPIRPILDAATLYKILFD
tara:strand:+ start:41 stop:1117 length:1077 start_codon:yes stop_codon:yes gene_type:complete